MIFLGVVVLGAALVQTSIGFGFMVVCMTVGALQLDVPSLVGVLVPLSTVQSTLIAVRDREHVDRVLLTRRILPLMLVGMLSAVVLIGTGPEGSKPLLGLGILVLALRELLLGTGAKPLPPMLANLGIVIAGIVQGLFVMGGPPLVWALGNAIPKRPFRATLAVVWMSLNTLLLAHMVYADLVNAGTLSQSAVLLVPLIIGLALGDQLHGHVDELRFRKIVWAGLGVAALPLIAKGIWPAP